MRLLPMGRDRRPQHGAVFSSDPEVRNSGEPSLKVCSRSSRDQGDDRILILDQAFEYFDQVSTGNRTLRQRRKRRERSIVTEHQQTRVRPIKSVKQLVPLKRKWIIVRPFRSGLHGRRQVLYKSTPPCKNVVLVNAAIQGHHAFPLLCFTN